MRNAAFNNDRRPMAQCSGAISRAPQGGAQALSFRCYRQRGPGALISSPDRICASEQPHVSLLDGGSPVVCRAVVGERQPLPPSGSW